LHDARDQVGTIIHALKEDQSKWGEELRPAAAERAENLASRLNPWEPLLRSVAAAYCDSKPMRLPTVKVRYCFPFAVGADEDHVNELSSALRRRVPGGGAEGKGRAADNDDVFPASRLDAALKDRLQCLDQGTANVKALELTDFWAGAGEGMFGGNRVELSALSDTHHPGDKWDAWIDLSRLENHCLCIERTLNDPTPHELYKALRCPADYSRDIGYRYGWAPRRSEYWRSLDEFAHDVILAVVQGMATKDEPEPEYIKGHFHIIVLVSADVSVKELNGLYGAEVLRTNVNRDAATLEEWVRYPIAKKKGKSEVAQGNFGYKENWWQVLDDTTIFGIVGNPSWQADSYLEAVQFAASWTPRLLLWNRDLMQKLEQGPRRKKLPDLRHLEQTVRRSVAAAHAEELCRLRSDRRYLEWMMDAVGTTSIQEDLERRILAMRLLITETEKKEQDRLDGRRNFFLGAIALFGVLNLSTLFAVLDVGDSSGFFKSRTAIDTQVMAQAALFVLSLAVFITVTFWRKKELIEAMAPSSPRPFMLVGGQKNRAEPQTLHLKRRRLIGTKGTLCGKAVLRSMSGIFKPNEATCKECPRRAGIR
jgi:hypothetical protein